MPYKNQRVRLADEPYVRDAAMSFGEIAKAMGISKQTAWFYYRQAIRKLRRNPEARKLRELAAVLSRD